MKRICLFAGYDSKNIIHDYVVYYLKELSTVSDIYYMADNEISETEKSKIMPYVKGAYGFNHKKYDFGSWYELIKIIGWEKISEYDELILANDSVFGPLYPMKDFFTKIEKDVEWDICGITRSFEKQVWHLNSYFLVFRYKAFTSDIFKEHLLSVKQEENVSQVIEKYEVPFMYKFYNNGYSVKVFCGLNTHIYLYWQEYCNAGVPFIKKKIFNKGMFDSRYKSDWREYIKNNTNYNIKYIEDYANGQADVDLEYIHTSPLIQFIKIFKDFYKWLIHINIKKGKFYFKLFGIYMVKINKKYYTYILFGKPMKSKMNKIPIKIINQ